jgi:hypothetical protein
MSCLTCWRSHIEWQNVQDVRSADYSGLAILKSDPQPIGRGVRVVLEIEGQRFESWLYGSSARRMSLHVSGESVEVVGQRRPNGDGVRRRQVRHIVGRFEVKVLRTVAAGAHVSESRFELAANRVRSALGQGSRVLSGDQAALFAGLVYGDDSQQPREMVENGTFNGSIGSKCGLRDGGCGPVTHPPSTLESSDADTFGFGLVRHNDSS